MVGRGRLLVVNITVGDSGSATWVHHCIRTSAMTHCVFRRIIFFHELGRPFFLLLRFFPFSFSFSLFFFFGTRLLTLRKLRYMATRLHACHSNSCLTDRMISIIDLILSCGYKTENGVMKT